jgi:hypothetical protein
MAVQRFLPGVPNSFLLAIFAYSQLAASPRSLPAITCRLLRALIPSCILVYHSSLLAAYMQCFLSYLYGACSLPLLFLVFLATYYWLLICLAFAAWLIEAIANPFQWLACLLASNPCPSYCHHLSYCLLSTCIPSSPVLPCCHVLVLAVNMLAKLLPSSAMSRCLVGCTVGMSRTC